MKVLVTGGAGFIGSHLVNQLIEYHDDVIVLDNCSTGDLSHIDESKIAFWNCDIRDEEIVKRIILEKPDAIVHLAAQTMVDLSIKDPVFDASENIMGTLNILEAARQCKARVIFASTAAAYGDVNENDLPVAEIQQLRPQSFYGVTKVGAEKYLELYHDIYGLDYVVCRFANVYGERQGDKGEGGVISIFAKRIAAGQDITIFGDGGQTRDFIYAGDIAEGICKAITTDNVNTIYNLSTQMETSLKDLVRIFGEVSGRDIAINYAGKREGDIYRSMLCNEKAISMLEWKPKTNLQQGIARTYQYFVTTRR